MSTVRFDERDRVAYVTLDRPRALNAFDEPTIAGLADAVARASADERLKALVVTGAGDVFSVGLDIDLLGRAFADTAYFRDVLERFNRLLLDVERAPLPVVAAVNGLARAGGFELMLAADLVLIASEARVGDTHLAFGIPPGGGGSQRLPRRIGQQRARELVLTGRWLDGDEAAAIGLALRAVPRASLEDAVEGLVDRLRPLSRPALAAAKAMMLEGAALPIERALDLELERFIRHLETEPSASEGYRAFVEKRDPSWP